jgi:hypothetical protein
MKDLFSPQRRRDCGETVFFFFVCREIPLQARDRLWQTKNRHPTAIAAGAGGFAHRRLPMGKTDDLLCVSAVSKSD